MNPYQSLSGRAGIGVSGLLALFLVAFVFVPMTPAGRMAPAGDPPPAGFEPVAVETLEQRIDAATAAIVDAFNRRDRAGYLAAFAEDALLMPDGAGLAVGRIGAAEMYLQVPSGLVYEPIRWADRDFFQIDRWIVETGLVGFQFRLTPEAPIMIDPRQVITIWEEGPDGALRVKLLSWNKLADIGALDRGRAHQAFAATSGAGAFESAGDFSVVLEAEEIFHQACEDKRVEDMAAYYADGATLIVPGTLPLRGQAEIARHFRAQVPAQPAVKVERSVVRVEGNADYVLVVNLFRWTFTYPDTGVPIPIVGKGVHVWQRDKDDTWRILFDLPNASQRTG